MPEEKPPQSMTKLATKIFASGSILGAIGFTSTQVADIEKAWQIGVTFLGIAAPFAHAFLKMLNEAIEKFSSASRLVDRVEQHSDSIGEIKIRVEPLESIAASNAALIREVESKVDGVEHKVDNMAGSIDTLINLVKLGK